MKILYEGKSLVCRYGSHIALDMPFFQLAEGEMVTLTGHNGSGKSTLLRLLAFLEKPASGSLQYFGNSLAPRREITLLLQEPYLFHDSVFRNVTLGLILRGECSNLQAAYEKAMCDAGFENPQEFANRRPGSLSGGEKQRVALASRLILQPRALLLDEPTSSVDLASARAIINVLKICKQNGTTIVCATHDREILDGLCARNINLD